MSEYEEISEVDEPVVVEHITVVEEPSPVGEMLRFFALIIILGVVVLVVAATRPLIFNRIVPAVMGEGIVVTTPDSATDEEAENINTPEEPSEAESVNGEAGNTNGSSDEGAATEENPVEETGSSEANAVEATNEGQAETQEGTTGENSEGETAETTTHTVSQGETLQKIASQYGITLQELIAANNLRNPNYIRVGDELIIPQKGNNP